MNDFDRTAILAAALLALSACSHEVDPAAPACELDPRTEALLSASKAPTYLALSAEQRSAIVRVDLRIERSDGGSERLCSGVLLAPNWVLTAKHCVEGSPSASDIRIEFEGEADAEEDGSEQAATERDVEPDAESGAPACGEARTGGHRIAVAPRPTSRASRVVPHPSRDVALLELEKSAESLGVFAASPAIDVERSIEAGELVQLAGFGVADDGNGELRFKAQRVASVDDRYVVVAPTENGGACVGDSGGPLLVRDADGAVALVGSLSDGSADCMGIDRYERIDAAFIHDIASPPPARSADADCGLLGDGGRCYGPLAMRCIDASLSTQRCREAAACMPSTDLEPVHCAE